MKKIFTFLFSAATVMMYSSSFAQISSYCTSGASSTFDSKIDNVALNTMSVASSPTACEQYTDNTSFSTTLNPGMTYTIEVLTGSCGGSFTNYQRAWIDYNQNGVFDDPSERLINTSGPPSPAAYTANFTVPATAVPGQTYMRVISAESGAPTPCGSYTWGETEDFTIFISAGAANDAGVASIDSPAAVPCGGGSANVYATIQNYGSNQIVGVTVNWSINGASQTPVVYSSLLDTINGFGPNTAQVNLGSAAFTGGTDIKVWTSNPNSVADTSNLNDTAQTLKTPPLNGAYTIDALGSGPSNFTSFVQAANALKTFGVCGPVTFYAASGTYVGQVVLDASITGISSTNTLTFMADTNNTAPVIVQSNSAGTSAQSGAWTIDNIGWVTVDGLEIEHTVNSAYTDVLALINGVHDIMITNCYIHRPYYTSTLANAVDVYTYSYDAYNLTFSNNIIEGGYYGMYLYGYATIDPIENLVVENNEVRDAYYYGIYCYYLDAPKFMDNYVNATGALSSTNSYGFRFYYCDSVELARNEIISAYYGLYIYYTNAGKFYNNKIHTGKGSNNGYYPIYVYYASDNELFYNTVVNESSSGYLTYFNSNSFNNRFVNNILAMYGSGNGVYLSSPLAASEMDNNAYFLDSSASYGIDYTQVFGHDSSSFYVVDTLFASLDSLFTCSTELPGRGKPLSEITVDYHGFARSMTSPTVGPHEYLAPGAEILPEDFKLCSPDTIDLIVPLLQTANYLWSDGDTTNMISIHEPGTYGVVISNLVCGSGVLQDEVVVTDAASIADFSSERFWKTVVFTNSSVNGESYLWDFGDGQSSTLENPTHLYDVNGTYNACLTVFGDCDTVTTCDSVLAHNSVGIGENANSNSFAIYPNPASDNITISANNVESNMLNVEISNIAGQVVMNTRLYDFNGSNKTIDISSLTKGVYFVKLIMNDVITTKRLVVQK